MNKKTKALTTEQYKEIIQTMREGFSGCRPNERIATALVLEGNLPEQVFRHVLPRVKTVYSVLKNYLLLNRFKKRNC